MAKKKKVVAKTPEDLVNEIRDACAALGWQIAMNESSEMVSGLIIGSPEYVDGILAQIEEDEEYSVYQSGEAAGNLQ